LFTYPLIKIWAQRKDYIMKRVKNILIVRTDRIGDVVLTTPSIKAVREAYPNARICVLISSYTVDLIKGNPNIDEIIIDDKYGRHKGIFGFFKLVSTIRKEKFDLAIIYHTKKRTNALCFLSGIPMRLGYKNNKFGFLLTHPVYDNRVHGIKHEAEYCLDLLKKIDIKFNGEIKLELPILAHAVDWLKQFLSSSNISNKDLLIVVHPGASDPSKQWPEELFVKIINKLSRKYQSSKFVVIGAKNLKNIAKNLCSYTNTNVINLCGMTTVAELVSLLNRADLLISNDSGPVHIAAAMNTPVVSIFTRNQPGINPERWRPLGPNSTFVSVKPDNSLSFKKSGLISKKYLYNISPDDVLEAVDSVFKVC